MDGSANPKRKDAVSVDEVETFIETKFTDVGDGLGKKWMLWRRKRYLVLVLAFLGQMIKESLRTNLSVAVLTMTENRTTTDENGSTIYVHDFDWDVKTRGFLLSVFFYGFVATQLLGGVLAVKYGGGKLFGLGVALTAVFTLLTPAAARLHFYLLVSLRILEGVCEGVLGPSLELINARWVPLQERSSCVAIVTTGTSWGVLIGLAVSSAVAHHWGWPAVFYLSGAVGMLWFAVWLFVVKESPKLDHTISTTEREYIEHSLKIVQLGNEKVTSIPYTKIFTSTPVLTNMLTYVPIYGCLVMLTTQLPAFIRDVLKLDIQNSGYVSSIPFVFKILGMYCFSPIADCLVNRRIFNVTTTRKVFICGHLVVVGALSFLIQQATSVVAVVACLSGIAISSGSGAVQIFVNILDMAPAYSSVLLGLDYTVAATFGMIVPVAVGYLTQNKTAEEWHTVFSIQAGMCLLASAIYGLFASGRLQPWAADKHEATPDSDCGDV